MLYFTGEVFHRLANQNRGHIRVMLEYRLIRGRDNENMHNSVVLHSTARRRFCIWVSIS